jgi:hypothetical protein
MILNLIINLVLINLYNLQKYKYIVMKLLFFLSFLSRNRQINHARNIWDRALTILPRANQFWYKFTYMEEMLGNIAGKIQISFSITYIFIGKISHFSQS